MNCKEFGVSLNHACLDKRARDWIILVKVGMFVIVDLNFIWMLCKLMIMKPC